MAQTGQRRSERVLLDVPLVVRGETSDHHHFQEETFSVTVSAHGALVMLATRVAVGQRLTLLNPQNWDERETRVAYIGPAHAGLSQVAVEFRKPSPEFWPIDPQPSGWKVS